MPSPPSERRAHAETGQLSNHDVLHGDIVRLLLRHLGHCGRGSVLRGYLRLRLHMFRRSDGAGSARLGGLGRSLDGGDGYIAGLVLVVRAADFEKVVCGPLREDDVQTIGQDPASRDVPCHVLERRREGPSVGL